MPAKQNDPLMIKLSNVLLGRRNGTIGEMITAAEQLQAKCEFLFTAIHTLRQAQDKTTAGMQSIWQTFETKYSERGFDK